MRRLRLTPLCVLFAVSRLLAMLHLRYGRLRSHLTLHAFYLCSLFLSSFWCWPASCADSCQQEGGSTRTHFLCFYVLFISSHTPLSFERESPETILLFSDSGGSEIGECGDNYPMSRSSCNRRVFRNPRGHGPRVDYVLCLEVLFSRKQV